MTVYLGGGGPGPLTWEMTSLKDDLNSCTSVVNRLTSCPVFLASKKAMSCLVVRQRGAGGGKEGHYFRTWPTLRPSPEPLGAQSSSHTLQLAVPEQVAEESPPHVHSHALTNVG
jgi:hypothetical protein